MPENQIVDPIVTAAPEPEQAAEPTEKEKILALATACFGAEASEKFAQVVNAGLTPEQVSSLGISIVPQSAVQSSSADVDSRQQILAAIKDGGEKPVGKVDIAVEEPKSFDVLVSEYQTANGCSRTEAMKAITKTNPEAHAAWLGKNN